MGKKMSLRARLLISVISVVLLGTIITSVILGSKTAALQQKTAMSYANQLAKYNGLLITSHLEKTMEAAKELADALGSMQASGIANREQADAILRGVLAGHENFLGVWSGWEPNAFDGQDRKYVGQKGHDETGRYVPYWNRGSGAIAVEPLADYEKPGAGDYYLLAKQSKQPVILEPYNYVVGGKEVLMTSLVVPIVRDGRFLGVAGVDIALSSLQEMVGGIAVFEEGYATLLSNTGIVVGDHDAKNVGENMTKIGFTESVRSFITGGKAYSEDIFDSRIKSDVTRLYVPVNVANTKTPWSFVATVPEHEIMLEVYEQRNLSIVLSLLSLIVVSVCLSLLLERLVLRPIGGDPEDAAAIANRVAQGDLSQPIHVRAGDTHSLMARLRDMQAGLSAVVTNVRQGAHSVATASAQIAQSNEDLSARTGSQASALEETSASMEELGSTVQNNADNAGQANNLAMNASQVAMQGSEVVGQVVSTMEDINDSSRKIADIISVIDGIAFQTNILALNAAVEAARAGEHGRGFAVVASEVRSLAQRSATAANEVKQLIGSNVERVAAGYRLVDEAGKTMHGVVSSIQRVTDIMGEISSASAEQSAGVRQVGLAITQMDQATQQNAGLVDEMAAAVSSLRGQADDLVQAVAVFKVS